MDRLEQEPALATKTPVHRLPRREMDGSISQPHPERTRYRTALTISRRCTVRVARAAPAWASAARSAPIARPSGRRVTLGLPGDLEGSPAFGGPASAFALIVVSSSLIVAVATGSSPRSMLGTPGNSQNTHDGACPTLDVLELEGGLLLRGRRTVAAAARSSTIASDDRTPRKAQNKLRCRRRAWSYPYLRPTDPRRAWGSAGSRAQQVPNGRAARRSRRKSAGVGIVGGTRLRDAPDLSASPSGMPHNSGAALIKKGLQR